MASSVTALGVLLVLPAVCALLLRWARCPGWSVLGGVIGGMVVGPTVFGRVAPAEFERLFVGGAAQRQALDELERRQGADVLAGEAARLGAGEMARLREGHAREWARTRRAVEEARWSHQEPLRVYGLTVTGLVLVGAGLLKVGEGDRRQGMIGASSIGLWSAAFPGALGFAAMARLWGYGMAESVLAAAAVGIGPWVLTEVDRRAADEAESGGAHMMERAGRIASGFAIAGAIGAMWAERGATGLLLGTVPAAMVIGWVLPGPGRKVQGFVRGVLKCAVVPTLAGCVAMKVEWYEDFALWPLVVFVILSGDGRWVGAFLGAMLPGGRRGLRTMRLVLGSAACGPTQLAVAGIGAHTWMLPGEIVMALLAGAVMVEVTTPVRRSMASRLAKTEEELDEMG